jgi:hypothetical protein
MGWSERMKPGESTLEASIPQIAQRIVDKRLDAPLIFLLEAMRPMAGLAAASFQALSPLLEPCLGAGFCTSFQRWLQDPSLTQRLLEELEQRAAQR